MTRVLLVGDEEDLRRGLRALLESADYDVAEAPDGRQALRFLSVQPADVVITDIVMPDMEGLELILRLRREHPRLRIIALSDTSVRRSDLYLEIAVKLGADRALPRPYKAPELLQVIRELAEG